MKILSTSILLIFSFAFISVQAQIINVPGDQPSIQAGIDAAFWGDTVLVADSHYYENIDFSGKGITVASKFIMDGDTNHINNTIIDGSQSVNPYEGSVVYFRNNEDTTSVLRGFTITGGTGTYVSGIDIWVSGGIHFLNAGGKIINNHIEYNFIDSNVAGSGGGISAGDSYNTNYVLIKNNRVCNNTVIANEISGGGGMEIRCNAIIKDNIVCNNVVTSETKQAVGGGIRVIGYDSERHIECSGNLIAYNEVYSSSMVEYAFAGGLQTSRCYGKVSNNRIMHNTIEATLGSVGGGIQSQYSTSTLLFENNFISENHANFEELGGKGGGICLAVSNPELLNNIIDSNFASYGGGIYNWGNEDGPTQIINNTIAFNQYGDEGGAIYLLDAEAVVLNSILWDNYTYGGEEIFLEGGSIEVAYSDVLDGWPGEGNIDEDPDFLDDMYHLQGGPCVDAGIDELTMMGILISAPEYDFEGQPRPLCGGYDMGADEALCEGIFDPVNTLSFDLRVSPNPTSGTIKLYYKTHKPGEVSMCILNMRGELLENFDFGQLFPGEQQQSLDLSYLPNGLYMIRLVAGNQSATSKIILHK